MKKTKIGNHTVEYYDSIEELPITRFQKFNKLLMIDAGVGSSITDLDTHLHRMSKYVEKGQTDKYILEVANLRQNFFLIMNEVTPKYRAFAALIKSIDGEETSDISDNGLEQIFCKIQDAPVKDVDGVISEVKKKLDLECSNYFPGVFEDSSMKEYYTKLRQWTLLVLERIQIKKEEERVEINRKIDNLADELLLFADPKSFSGKNNEEVEFDKAFDSTCMFISQHLHVDPSAFTVLRFYNALTFVKDQVKREQKQLKNIRR